jgi:predicted P-loop ATPase
MATIRKRGDYQWQAQIRKNGFSMQSKTFDTKQDAQAWANTIKSEISRGVWQDRSQAEQTTLNEISSAKRFGLPTGYLVDYVTTIAGENSYHPVADWIESKPWDGISRLQALCDTLVTNDRQISSELKQMLFLR